MPKPVRRKRTEAKGRTRKIKKGFSIRASFEKAFKVFNNDRRPFLELGAYLFVCFLLGEGFGFWLGKIRYQTDGALVVFLEANLVLVWIIDFVFTVELVRLSLEKVKGKKSAFKTTYESWLGTARYFHAGVLCSLTLMVGTLLLVVPGVIAFAAFFLAPYAALEYRTKTWWTLGISWELTRDVRVKMLGLMLVSCLVLVLGVLCLGVGLIVAWPLTTLAWVVVYRELERQTKLPKLELLKAKV